jgi:hypothetical protein
MRLPQCGKRERVFRIERADPLVEARRDDFGVGSESAPA